MRIIPLFPKILLLGILVSISCALYPKRFSFIKSMQARIKAHWGLIITGLALRSTLHYLHTPELHCASNNRKNSSKTMSENTKLSLSALEQLITTGSCPECDLSDLDLTPPINSIPDTLQPINLSGANLRRSKLKDANLSNADLKGADFTDADLRGADLSHANCSDATFTRTILSRVKAENTNFYNSTFTNVYWQGIQAKNANFNNTKINTAVGKNVNFTGATFKDALIKRWLLR